MAYISMDGVTVYKTRPFENKMKGMFNPQRPDIFLKNEAIYVILVGNPSGSPVLF